jgi:hypothetical protein
MEKWLIPIPGRISENPDKDLSGVSRQTDNYQLNFSKRENAEL